MSSAGPFLLGSLRFQDLLGFPSQQKAHAAPHVVAASGHPQIKLLDLIPSHPMGFPLVAWIGGVIFLFILILLFGSVL